MQGDSVLVVEDSRTFGGAMVRALAKGGFETVWARSLGEAKEELAKERSWLAAVLDLNLPDAPGGEVVDLVAGWGVPSLVLTGETDEATRRRILEKPILDYFVKDSPDVFDSVAGAVEQLFRNRELWVLVVDDSGAFCEFLSGLLARHNYRVLTARDGAEALSLLDQGEQTVRLVITDYVMPGMDGIELTRELRSRFDRDTMAVIGVSAHGDEAVTAGFLKGGASDFLTKPFSVEEFYQRVRQNVGLLERIDELKRVNADKDRFLGMAAHDLRTPIATLSGYGSILQGGVTGELTDAQRELVERIERVSGHMLELVNDLLDVSVIESGRLVLDASEGDLGDLVADRVRAAQGLAAQKDMRLETRLAQNTTARFDAERMGQVVDNLLSNAVKFSPAGSVIRVGVGEHNGSPALWVEDQGPGLSDEDKARLFKEFEKLSARPTGGEKSTGLGLAIVKRIVDAHGGTVAAEDATGNAAGGGARFVVVLPG